MEASFNDHLDVVAMLINNFVDIHHTDEVSIYIYVYIDVVSIYTLFYLMYVK